MNEMTNALRSIYALADPREPRKIRYIGQTKLPLHRRLCGHVAESKKKIISHRLNWIRGLSSLGLCPVIWPLEVGVLNWEEREKFWIAFFKPTGWLTNGTDGGEGAGPRSFRWSEEQKKRMSEQRRGKPAHPNSLKAISKFWGQKHRPDSIEKMRRYHLGKHPDLPALKRGWGGKPVLSDQFRKELSERAKKNLTYRVPVGFKMSQAQKDKIRDAQKGKIRPHVTMPGGKPVVCIETGERFVSIWRAAQRVGAACNKIKRSIRRGIATRGLHWRFE